MKLRSFYLQFVIFITFSALAYSALIYIPGIPVNKRTLLKTQIALDRWENNLNATYKTKLENRAKIQMDTYLAEAMLAKMRAELAAYDNVIIGSQDKVLGSKNIIFGSRNKLYGNHNIILSQNFDYSKVKGGSITTPIENVLVDGKWLAYLDKRNQIRTNLYDVIYPTA